MLYVNELSLDPLKRSGSLTYAGTKSARSKAIEQKNSGQKVNGFDSMMANGDVGIGSWNCGRDGEYRERITFRKEDILLPVTMESLQSELD